MKANLGDMFKDYSAFLHIYRNSYHVHDFLARSHTTVQTERITDMMWPARKKQAVFISSSQWLSTKEIQRNIFLEFNTNVVGKRKMVRNFARQIQRCRFRGEGKFTDDEAVTEFRNKDDDRLKPITVRIYDSSWLSGDNLTHLYSHLASTLDSKMFDNLLIDALLRKHNYTMELSVFFLAFMLKLMLTLTYFYWVISDFEQRTGYNYFRAIIVLLNAYQLYQEVKQLKRQGFVYFRDFWNTLQWVSGFLNILIVFFEINKSTDFDEDSIPVTLTILPSISSLIMVFQVFYWMSLYKKTSFYVTLITQALIDIGPFLVMVFVGICSFANAVLVLDRNQTMLY